MIEMFSDEKLCIDIRGRVMKYTQARYDRRKNSIEIKRYGSILFPKEYVDGGTVSESEDTIKIIANFIKKEKITTKNVYINISDQSIVLRLVKVPQMSKRDLKDYLDMEISQYLPVDIKANIYDYKVLNTFEAEDKKMMDLLLTSVSRELILNYMQLFKKAGLNPLVVDVYPNSIARVFSGHEDGDIAVVDLNGNSIDFVILKEGKLFMYSNGLIENEFVFSSGMSGRVDVLLGEDETFAGAVNEVTNYVRTYMNFFSSRHFGKNIDKLYVLGELAMIKDIGEYFRSNLHVKVGVGLPSAFKVETGKNMFDYNRKSNIDKSMSVYSCNLGLVLRGV